MKLTSVYLVTADSVGNIKVNYSDKCVYRLSFSRRINEMLPWTKWTSIFTNYFSKRLFALHSDANTEHHNAAYKSNTRNGGFHETLITGFVRKMILQITSFKWPGNVHKSNYCFYVLQAGRWRHYVNAVTSDSIHVSSIHPAPTSFTTWCKNWFHGLLFSASPKMLPSSVVITNGI